MDGKRIAAARKAKGWSQEKLGQMMGLSQQAIAKYEGPRGDVSGETLLQLSGVLGVTVSYLLGVDDAVLRVRYFYGCHVLLPAVMRNGH